MMSKIAWCSTCDKEIPAIETRFNEALKTVVHSFKMARKPGCTPCGEKIVHHIVRFRAISVPEEVGQ